MKKTRLQKQKRGLPSAVLVVALGLSCLPFAGCKHTESEGGPAHPPTYATVDPATAGSVTGTIHFTGKMPPHVQIDMAQDPACSISSAGANYTQQYVGENGELANVFIYVKDGLGNRVYAPPRTPVVLDQKGCRYVPHVLGVMVGQPVEFRNSDPTMHNVHPEVENSGNQSFDISQPPNGGTAQHVFTAPDLMMPVRCNNHPWMQAFLNVVRVPFYAVSANDGKFSITGLPPGVYTLEADHEVLGKQQATVTVTTHGTAIADFTYGPAK